MLEVIFYLWSSLLLLYIVFFEQDFIFFILNILRNFMYLCLFHSFYNF